MLAGRYAPRCLRQPPVLLLLSLLAAYPAQHYLFTLYIYIYTQRYGMGGRAKEKSGRKFSCLKVDSLFALVERERLGPRAGHYCIKKNEDKKKGSTVSIRQYVMAIAAIAPLYILHPVRILFFFLICADVLSLLFLCSVHSSPYFLHSIRRCCYYQSRFDIHTSNRISLNPPQRC